MQCSDTVVVLCVVWGPHWALENWVQTGNATGGSSRYMAKKKPKHGDERSEIC